MKHLQVIASSLAIAIAGMMLGSTAGSQINIRVNPEPRGRQHIVHHPRSRVHVRVNVPPRHRIVRYQDERRNQDRRAYDRRQERQRTDERPIPPRR